MGDNKHGKKRVAIIGGGISGLLAIKACLEEDLEPHCFERYGELGGVWVYSEQLRPGQGSAIYSSLVTNSSKTMMAFSDFPMPKEYPPYLSHQHVLNYVQDYAKHFNLEKYIQYNTTVTSVKLAENFKISGQWKVTTQRVEEGKAEDVIDIYDAVMVCSGISKKPRVPQYPGLEHFEGLKMHSNEYRTPQSYKEKNVLVMGAANSAGDIASELSWYTEQVHLSMRHGCWVIRRMAEDSVPVDMAVNRRALFAAPTFIRGRVAESKASVNMNYDKLGLQAEAGLLNSEVMINDSIADRIFCGKVQCRPSVKKFTRNGVEFVDGKLVERLDAVVFATGYDLEFEFIDKDIVQDSFEDIELYLHVFPPRLRHHTLAVIGCVSALGGQPPVFELQARLSVRVFKGLVQLPDDKTMLADIERRRDYFYKTFGKHKLFFPPIPYQDEIASLIGVKPRMRDFILTDPKLALQLYFGPCYPAHYRLRGPHKWQGARKTITESWDSTINPLKTRKVVKPNEGNTMPMYFMGIFIVMCGIALVIIVA